MFKKILLLLCVFISLPAGADPIKIVAAENVYGDIAQMIGGDYVQVVSILKNPQQDPHLFSSSPITAKAIANAQIIIYNGIGYDSWIKNLIAVNAKKQQDIIVVADLGGLKIGDNPHIWYNPKIIEKFAVALTAKLSQIDSANQAYYQQQLQIFEKNLQKLLKTIQQIRNQYQGVAIIATEPVFNDMAEALSLVIKGKNFQLSIMNGTEPSFSEIKDFEDQLKNQSVKVLIFNNQVSNPLIEHLLTMAKKSNIAIVGVSETQPNDQDYFVWMNQQLEQLRAALSNSMTKSKEVTRSFEEDALLA